MRIKWYDWGFSVLDDDMHLTVEKYENGKHIDQERIEVPAEKHPVLSAAYDSRMSMWYVDMHAGMQRWRGAKSGKALSLIMLNFFSPPEIRKIMGKARRLDGRMCPSY